MGEAVPVADFPVEQGHGQRAQAMRDFFVRHAGFQLRGQRGEGLLAAADLFDHGLKLPAHELRTLRRDLLPLPGPGPAGGQALVFELDAQGPAVIFQTAHLPFPELPLPAQLASLLLGPAGDADGPQLVGVAIEMTGQAHAQLARIEPIVLAPALRRQAQRRGHQRVRPRRTEFLVQGVAEATGFIDGVHGVAGLDLLAHPGDELGAGKFGGGFDRAVIALAGGDHEVQVHIQAQLEDVARGGRAGR
jgi:hypothetical protein